MQSPISGIEYVLPTEANPLGNLSFSVSTPIIFDPNRQVMKDNPNKNVALSPKTLELTAQLSASIIADMEN